MHSETYYYPDLQQFYTAAAEFVCRRAREAVAAHGSFTMALSGGSTPRPLFERLAQAPYITQMPWEKSYLFWGDERYVPAGHEASNFLMAAQAFITTVPIPTEHVLRVPTEAASPEMAAEQYEQTLRTLLPVFAPSSREKEVPVFDLMLLGMGPDGHTASLFPGSPALDETERWVVATPSPRLEPPVRRITLTFPVINAADTILFLIRGVEKQAILTEIREQPEEARRAYPAARIQGEGRLFYFVAE